MTGGYLCVDFIAYDMNYLSIADCSPFSLCQVGPLISCLTPHEKILSSRSLTKSFLGLFFCCLIFLIRDGKDHIEHQWLMMISRSGSCVIVSGPIWTWQSRTTIGIRLWPNQEKMTIKKETQMCGWCAGGVFHIEDHILLDWQRSTRALFMFCSLKREILLDLWGIGEKWKGQNRKIQKCLKRKKTFDHWSLGQF